MVKNLGHRETTNGQVSTLGGIFFTCLWNASAYFNKNWHSNSLPGPCDTDDIFKVIGLKVKVTDNIFENALFWLRHID